MILHPVFVLREANIQITVGQLRISSLLLVYNQMQMIGGKDCGVLDAVCREDYFVTVDFVTALELMKQFLFYTACF